MFYLIRPGGFAFGQCKVQFLSTLQTYNYLIVYGCDRSILLGKDSLGTMIVVWSTFYIKLNFLVHNIYLWDK